MEAKEEEQKPQVYDSPADARAKETGMPTSDERSAAEKEIAEASREVDAAIAMAGDSPELQSAKQALSGSVPVGVDVGRQQIEQLKREAQTAKDKAREKEGEKLMESAMGMVLPLAILGTVANEGKKLNNKVKLSGGDIPPGALFTAEVYNGLANVARPAEQRQSTLQLA